MKFQLSQEEQARCGCSPHLKCIADGESNQPGRDIEAQFSLEVALDGRKQGSKEDDKVAHKLQTNGQPPGEGEREGGRERGREGWRERNKVVFCLNRFLDNRSAREFCSSILKVTAH